MLNKKSGASPVRAGGGDSNIPFTKSTTKNRYNGQSARLRFFVLKGNLLFYYKSPHDRIKDPVGFICLEGYAVALETRA